MPRKTQPAGTADRIESELDRLDPAPRERLAPPGPPRPRRKVGTVERAVRAELKVLPDDLRKGGIAAVIIELAQVMDLHVLDPRNQSGHAREIRQGLMTLREMAPGERKGDQTDEVRERRERRLTAADG